MRDDRVASVGRHLLTGAVQLRAELWPRPTSARSQCETRSRGRRRPYERVDTIEWPVVTSWRISGGMTLSLVAGLRPLSRSV